MTRSRSRLTRAIALLLGLALVAAACGDDDTTVGDTSTTAGSDDGSDDGSEDGETPDGDGASAPGVSEDTVRVSIITTQTGVNAAGHEGFAKGLQVYLEYLNDEGGVHGRQVELVETYDDQSEAARNAELWRQAESGDDIFAVLGSTPAFGGAEFAIENDIPVVGTTYTREMHRSDSFFGVTGGTWEAPDFNNLPEVPPTAVDGYIMAKQGDTTMGTFGYTQAASAEAAETACERVNDFSDAGLECAYTDTSLEFGFTDLGASIAQIQSSGATHFYAAMDIGGCVTVLRSFLRAGMNDVTLRCAVGYGDETLENFGDVIEGRTFILLTTQPFDSDHPAIQSFLEELSTRMPGEDPSTTILNGWIAGMFFHDVLDEVGPELTREGFIETGRTAERFAAWDADGIQGGIDWTNNRHEQVLAGTYDPDPDLCSGILLRPDVDDMSWVQVGYEPSLCLAGIDNGEELLERIEDLDDDSSLELP